MLDIVLLDIVLLDVVLKAMIELEDLAASG